MADSALTELPEVTTSTDGDLLYTVQGGNARKTTRVKVIGPAVRHDIAQTLTDDAKTQARNNISAAALDSTGKVPLDQLPEDLFNDIQVVSSQEAMLALNVPKGSIAVRTDVNKNFILRAEPASTLANWIELAMPTAPVTSVNNKTGAVSLAYTDLGEIPNAQLPSRLQALTVAALSSTRDARAFGTYYAGSATTNRPSGSGVGFVLAIPQSSSYLRQVYYDRDTNRAWTCSCVNDVFSAWVEMPSDISALQSNLETTSTVELGRGLSGDRAAFIDFHAEGAPGAVDRSARIVRNAGTNGTILLSNNGSGGIVLSASGGVNIPTGPLNSQWAYDNTTVSAANVYITSSAAFARSTSSAQFKTDVEDLDEEHRDLIMELRPVWYRSLCELDNPEWSYYGLIAEEVAEIDPRLVHWQTSETTYEEKRSTVSVDELVKDAETGEETVKAREVEIVEQVPREVQLEEPRPVGVMYDRLVPHLIAKIQELSARLEALENPAPAQD